MEDVRAFDGLREHVGWRRLLNKVGADRDGFLIGVAKRLMAGFVVDQREIDFHRGFYEGALFVLEMPEKAEENLEAAARRAYAMTQLEQLNTELEESPYA